MTEPAAPRAVGAPARLFLAAVLALGVAFGFATTASATTRAAAQNAVGASTVALASFVGVSGDVSPATHLESYDSQAKTASATGVAANTASLTARADELAGVLDPIAQSNRTSAVLSTQEGVNVLAGGGRDLSPLQRALAGDGDMVARLPGAHAEVTAVSGALDAGLTPTGLGVSRAICPACQAYLEGTGATVSGKTAWWGR